MKQPEPFALPPARRPRSPHQHPSPSPTKKQKQNKPEDLRFRQAPTFADCFPGSTKAYQEVDFNGTTLRVSCVCVWCFLLSLWARRPRLRVERREFAS